jgi:hypothetical protein
MADRRMRYVPRVCACVCMTIIHTQTRLLARLFDAPPSSDADVGTQLDTNRPRLVEHVDALLSLQVRACACMACM